MTSTSTSTRNELTRSTPDDMLAAAAARGGLTEIHPLAIGQSAATVTASQQAGNLDRFADHDGDTDHYESGRVCVQCEVCRRLHNIPPALACLVYRYRGFWIVTNREGRAARVFA